MVDDCDNLVYVLRCYQEAMEKQQVLIRTLQERIEALEQTVNKLCEVRAKVVGVAAGRPKPYHRGKI